MPIEIARWDIAGYAVEFRRAEPFPHLVIDDLLEPRFLGELAEAFDQEPAENIQDEIFDVMASSAPPVHPAMRRFHEALASDPLLEAVGQITGEVVRGVETRAYAYLPGHYLLPHADSDAGGRRRVAYAFYVATLEGLRGGELDLYRSDVEGAEVLRTAVAATIAPRANRCVLLGVGPRSLHRVREVTAGGRLSLAGWFVR